MSDVNPFPPPPRPLQPSRIFHHAPVSKLAIASFMLALIGWIALFVLPYAGSLATEGRAVVTAVVLVVVPIVATAAGHASRAAIRKAVPPDNIGGKGLALAGIITAYLELALVAFVIAAVTISILTAPHYDMRFIRV